VTAWTAPLNASPFAGRHDHDRRCSEVKSGMIFGVSDANGVHPSGVVSTTLPQHEGEHWRYA